jgi:hypothetical protein
MRWIWSGVLTAGLLLVLWGVFEAGGPSGATGTSDTVRCYGEDGTPVPPPPLGPKSPSQP